MYIADIQVNIEGERSKIHVDNVVTPIVGHVAEGIQSQSLDFADSSTIVDYLYVEFESIISIDIVNAADDSFRISSPTAMVFGYQIITEGILLKMREMKERILCSYFRLRWRHRAYQSSKGDRMRAMSRLREVSFPCVSSRETTLQIDFY